MNCPVCHVALTMSDRQGIEIDYCPQCRGVWLDRGELDKIIERSIQPTQNYQQPTRNVRTEHYDSSYQGYGQQYDSYKRHKKKSFLGEIFDFD